MQTGIIFSGGATKIAGHAGYGNAFARFIPEGELAWVAGVSAGAIIAPFVANRSVTEMKDVFTNLEHKMFFKKSPVMKNGFLSFYGMKNILQRKPYLGDMSNLSKTIKKYFTLHDYQMISNQNVEIFAESVDLNTGDIRITSNFRNDYDEMIQGIEDSATIPIFGRVTGKVSIPDGYNYKHADGGIRNHIPLKFLENRVPVNRIIVVFSRPESLRTIFQHNHKWKPRHIIDVFTRTFEIMNYEISKSDEELLESYCMLKGIELIKCYMPAKPLNGYFDVDHDRLSSLYNWCFLQGQSICGRLSKLEPKKDV